jgi:hypothetical protein
MPGGGKGGGGTTSTVNVNNGPISVDSDSTVEVNGLDRIGVTARLDPLQLRQELVVPEPIVTESRLNTNSDINARSAVTSESRNALDVDLKPVVLDVCATTSTRLPHGEISQPFNLHFGLTWFGMEFFGFNFAGQSRTVMQDLPRKPSVEWPAQRNSAPPRGSSPASPDEPRASGGPGLRVRLKRPD